jgi:hypothetical protein
MLSRIGLQLPVSLAHLGMFKASQTHHSSLFTKSPNPGVSTTVSLRRTPFSSMSVRKLYEHLSKRVRAVRDVYPLICSL